MTSLLEKAFDVASKLPALEQDILAKTLRLMRPNV